MSGGGEQTFRSIMEIAALTYLAGLAVGWLLGLLHTELTAPRRRRRGWRRR